MWRNHEEYLKKEYGQKRVLWSGSYFIASCGGVTIEQLRKYVEQYAERYPLGQNIPSSIDPAHKGA